MKNGVGRRSLGPPGRQGVGWERRCHRVTRSTKKTCLSCFHDRFGTFILHVPPTAKMIFISAAAVIFLVTKFKEIDWAKTCVVLPDDEEDHERYFLSNQPHTKVGDEPTPQMVRSVSDGFHLCFLMNCSCDGRPGRTMSEGGIVFTHFHLIFITLPFANENAASCASCHFCSTFVPSFFVMQHPSTFSREQNSLSCVQALAFQ